MPRICPKSILRRIIALLQSKAFKDGEITLVMIAKRFGCTPRHIANVRKSIR